MVSKKKDAIYVQVHMTTSIILFVSDAAKIFAKAIQEYVNVVLIRSIKSFLKLQWTPLNRDNCYIATKF